jgi:hypothetical protein
VVDCLNGDPWANYITGYTMRKGGSMYGEQLTSSASYTGCISFRSAEAFLNYLEACYEKNGSLDSKAQEYWRALRTRAGVNTDFDKTIAATDVSKETLDWGAYSGGQLVDATLYNIRRERRAELYAEYLRFADLLRWRALDQLINPTTPYHFEGMKIWGPMQEMFKNEDGTSTLIPNQNMSPPDESPYIRPFRIYSNNDLYGGCKFKMARYLSYIGIDEFVLTTLDGDLTHSSLYQNPGYSLTSGEAASY